MKRLKSSGKILLSAMLLCIMSAPVPAAAAGAGTGAVAQTYNAAPGVLPGMIVQLKPQDSTTVIPLSGQDAAKMTGIVVPVNDAAATLSSPATARQVLIANSGRYSLLVSTQNGSIKTGDYVAISALDGIGMKAGADQPQIVGRAGGNFDGKANVIDTAQLKSTTGHGATVAIGQVPVDVSLAANPQYQNNNNLPGVLSKAVSIVTDKKVSPARVYLSAAVLAASLFIAGSVFYAGIRGSMIAVGRNPLARRVVNRDLFQTIIFGLIVIAIGVLLTYVIIT